MSEFERESLSALLDGETDELELRRILQKSESDPSILETWGRYNLVHSVLTATAVPVSSGFANAFADKLDAESPLSVSSRSASSGTGTWKQSLSKFAVAASVAIVGVVWLQTANQPDSAAVAGSDLVPVNNQQVGQEPRFVLAASPQVEPDSLALQRLTDYLSSAMTTKEDEPVHIEHIQDSPLYRLVNNLQVKP